MIPEHPWPEVNRAGDDGADSIAHENWPDRQPDSIAHENWVAASQEEDSVSAPATLSFEDDTLSYDDYPISQKVMKTPKPPKPVLTCMMTTPKKAMKPATTSTLPNSASHHVKHTGFNRSWKDPTDAIELEDDVLTIESSEAPESQLDDGDESDAGRAAAQEGAPPNAMKEMKSVAVGTQPWDELKMDLVEDDEVRKKLLMEMRTEMLQVRLRGGPWSGHY